MEFERKRWKHMIAAMLLALCSGIGYTWSVFQKPLMEEFGWGLKTISLTFTIQVMISTIAPVFLGKFQKKLGIKKYIRVGIGVYVVGLVLTMFTSSITYLYIVYGVIVGIGIAMLYPSLITYSTSLFPDKAGMASGMLACSYGSGAILWAPITMFFMQDQGVLSVFGILSAIFAVVMIPTSFFIENVPEDFNQKAKKAAKKNNNIVSSKDYTWQEMVKTPRYYILVTILTLGTTAGLMITGHASTVLQEVQNYTAEKAAFLVGMFSIFNSIGRLVFGSISDGLGRYNIMMFLFAVIAGSMLLLTKASGNLFVASLLAINACYGGFTSMFSPICADNFGLKNLAINYSFLYVAYGLAGAIGPQLAARIKMISGGYNLAFLTVAAMSILGLILTIFLKVGSYKRLSNATLYNKQ